MPFWKHLWWPLALIWGLGSRIRNGLYDSGFLNSAEFDVPVIGIGNLSMGGSGKTPHVEYFIYRFREERRMAVLSRGYRRRTIGFRIAGPGDMYPVIGDEPRQIKAKFPDITVAVGENRALAIPNLIQAAPATQWVVLDDAFQHRAVRPALNILLTPHRLPFWKDHLFPVGWLRETASNAKRADILIVTQCPDDFGPEQESAMREACPLAENQRLFFSRYRYTTPYRFLNPPERREVAATTSVLLFSGIAHGGALLTQLEAHAAEVLWMEFDDHYNYEQSDLETLFEAYRQLDSADKMIVTTEKDAVRLEPYADYVRSEGIAIYCLPVLVEFIGSNRGEFDNLVMEYLNFFQRAE